MLHVTGTRVKGLPNTVVVVAEKTDTNTMQYLTIESPTSSTRGLSIRRIGPKRSGYNIQSKVIIEINYDEDGNLVHFVEKLVPRITSGGGWGWNVAQWESVTWHGSSRKEVCNDEYGCYTILAAVDGAHRDRCDVELEALHHEDYKGCMIVYGAMGTGFGLLATAVAVHVTGGLAVLGTEALVGAWVDMFSAIHDGCSILAEQKMIKNSETLESCLSEEESEDREIDDFDPPEAPDEEGFEDVPSCLECWEETHTEETGYMDDEAGEYVVEVQTITQTICAYTIGEDINDDGFCDG
jgi:hypothetical protein